MRVAITGASGSLGQALMRRFAANGADRIVAFSRDEQKRAAMARAYSWHPGVRVYAGDIRDCARLPDMFRSCEVVIHAAARKVVTAHPDEPEEMLKTNILGSLNVIDAASRAGVKKVLVISSDKAVRAENVYGVSKAMMEHLAVMANGRLFDSGMRVAAVRYGNVIGSNGSVVVRWRQQLARGEPLSITDPTITRFWITMPQAVDLIEYAISNMRGGEIIVPHLPAAPLSVLADAMGGQTTPLCGSPLERAGGPRQGGEKIHEELISPGEARRTVKRNNRYIVPPFQHDEMWDGRAWLGDAVPDGFSYCSETWPWRATVDEMTALLQESADA